MVQLLKQQLSQSGVVGASGTVLPQSTEAASDTATSLEPIVVTDMHPVDEILRQDAAAASPVNRCDGTRLSGARPPLLHSASLPAPDGPGTSLTSSPLATVLMERMTSLETLVAEQQRKSEANMARLLNQVRLVTA